MKFLVGSNKMIPEPDLYAVPDTTNSGWGMDHILDTLYHNKQLPNKGDVIADIDSCSMGVSVRRDTRYRVVGPGRYDNSVLGVSASGKEKIFYPHYMRRDKKIPRFWYDFH